MASLQLQVLKRSFSMSAAMTNAIKEVTVIGGGLMGSGIAQVAAQSGHKVTIVDVNEDAVKKAQTNIQTSLQRIAKRQFKDNPTEGEKFVKQVLDNVKTTVDLPASVKNADLVVEAVLEKIDIKHKVFSTIDKVAPSHTIFASNTSSLSVGEIASSTNRKDRFGGLHFFSPVPVMKLLEVIRIPDTSEDTYQKMMAWGKAIGKTTITCRDTPGFIVNSFLVPYLAQAMRFLERGDATAKDIDTAMKLGAGYPMGPLELADFVGLDVNKSIIDGWHEKFPDDPLYQPIPLLNKLVSEGKLGVKTGEGFHKYKK